MFAAVCVVLAAAGHSIASGRTVPVWSLALGWLSVVAITAPLAGRERGLPGIAGLLAIGQVTLHAVFNVGQMCGSVPLSGAGTLPGSTGGSGGLLTLAGRLVCGGHGGHGGHLTADSARHLVTAAGLHLPAAAGQPASGTALHVTGMGSGCTLPMLLGHLLAAVVAGWLLRRGESALWRLVRGVSKLATAVRRAFAAAAALAEPVRYAGPRAACAPRADRTPPRTVLLRHSLDRRGPPCWVTAA